MLPNQKVFPTPLVCVPDRDQNSSLLCISSSFLFNIGIVHHFDMVNHLDTVETMQAYTDSKHVFTFISLLIPRIAKSLDNKVQFADIEIAWERCYAFT